MNQTLTQIQEDFDKLWDILEPEVCTRVKTHNTHRVDDYVPLDSKDIKDFLTQSNKRVLEKVKQDIKQIMNRCKTERGLGIALANYLSTLIEQK